MKKFWKDWIAIWSAAVGMVLMAFTLAWRINPVEGSVVPRFLFDNPLGVAVFWVLFVTCMPVWIVGMMLTVIVLGDPVPDWLSRWLPNWFYPSYLGVFMLQGAVYFLIGKGVSACVRRLRRKDFPAG
jgi:hypothetical protein